MRLCECYLVDEALCMWEDGAVRLLLIGCAPLVGCGQNMNACLPYLAARLWGTAAEEGWGA